MPKNGLTLEDKQETIKLLSRAGASIGELNQVRTALSGLKGGQLAQLANGAQVVSLILSDIIGDPLHLIASGPTVQPLPESSTALDIVTDYNLQKVLPLQVIKCLEAGSEVQNTHHLYKNASTTL
jgi:glycerate 2-kinase